MARPSGTGRRRSELVAVLARAFAELGFRRATTAELARRCDVQETILYRLWPGKREMFVAAIGHVFAESEAAWAGLLDGASEGGGATAKRGAARRILAYEASHHGQHGLYRLVFAGLSECDDPEVRAALRRMYGRYHRFVAGQIATHRGGGGGTQQVAEAAWAIVGLGTVANLTRELGLLGVGARAQLIERVGALLLGGAG